ncbi:MULTISPECIES: dienelactone hydrolase family protein [Aphanothece]|uniref:dienelactone hydrolase family protein n=1 Tax=Aphanothece TaxID=1121 RepID=UPI0039846402
MSNPGPHAVCSGWQLLSADGASPPLRCWWARPAGDPPRAAVLVLPEVFGLNGWVRDVADRLAAAGYGALALPIFARTAPELDAAYDAAGLALGRQHRDQVTADQFLDDARRAVAWLQSRPGLEQRPIGCVGFCFGGHLALLASTLPQVAATCDFYGARVSTDRPGGGPPTLAVLPEVPGNLICFCGAEDPLMPPAEQEAIAAALAAEAERRPERTRRLVVAPRAGHGYMCEARADFRPQAAAEGWTAMLEIFAASLKPPAPT